MKSAEEKRDSDREWRKNNLEKARASSREWRKRNREKDNAQFRERYKKNREREITRVREWRDKNPEKARASTNEWRRKNKEKVASAARKWYNIHREEKIVSSAKSCLKRLERKAGRPKPSACEVCGAINRVIHFDHNHLTGKFRGWVCRHCNVILGFAKDSPRILRKLARYLENSTVLRDMYDYELHAC